MSLSMYADEQAKYLDTFAIDGNVEPGALKGMLGAGAKLIPKAGAQIARGASLLGAPVPIALDALSTAFSTAPKSTLLQDMYFGATVEPAEKAVEHWTPAPHEVGWATEAVYSVFGVLPPILLAPIPTIASMAVDTAREVHSKPGVSLPQALGVGAVAGLSQYAGVKATLWGRAELEAIGIAAGFNWAQGVVTRGAQSAILSGTEAQKDFQPFGLKEQGIDILMALAMTPAFRRIKAAREEGQRDFYSIEQGLKRWYKGDEGKSPFEAELKATTKAVHGAMREWAENAKPSDVDALLGIRQARHMAVDSLPGRPSSPASVEAHVTALKARIGQLISGEPTVDAPPVAKETLDQFTERAATDIAGNSDLASTIQLLQRAYIEQGPEAGRVMLDEMVAQLPPEERHAGLADEVHQQLTEKTQEWHDAQQPAFLPDPQRQADAMEITRGMQEAAPRIAREEGLPEGPSILLPIADQLKAHFMETGYRKADGTWHKMDQAEADEYVKKFAALEKPNFEFMSSLTEGKMSPEQLYHRYLAGVKMKAPAPEGALEQRITPAQHIADYKPVMEKSEYGGTRYRNKYLDLGNSTAYGKGEKGDRRAFRIMDKSGGSAADVGFVILEIDRNGKFAALRNIEIRGDVRSKGLGENVVATLVAHNGPGYKMDIVDITHAGGEGIGSKTDALPFWKKMGTQLKNYSRDPGVQMDGMLSLEDYLGARSGQGTAEGDRGAAATNLPANRGAAGTAGSGMPRGGPTAADRAYVTSLLGEERLFQTLPGRVPTAVGLNPSVNDIVVPDLAGLKLDKEQYDKAVDAVWNDPGMRETGVASKLRSTDARAEYLINRMVDNLLWLHDQMPIAIRQRAKLWYDGAQRIAQGWSGRWGKTRAQSAGILAVLSPQKDWFMNTTMGERVGDILHGKMQHTWDESMTAAAFKFLVGDAGKADPEAAKNTTAFNAAKGKTLAEVVATGDKRQMGVWIRAYDEAHHGAAHAVITPEGGFAANKLTAAGEEARRAWGDFVAIGKAASIFVDGRPENISANLGQEHKVRNFYNNIYDATDPRFTTIDTHAVAAAQLRPLAGSDKPVTDNFGATGGTNTTGISGTYPLYYEAYKRAAAARGLIPREMQSITWEGVRGLFTEGFKNTDNKAAVDAIWKDYSKGKMTLDEARTKISDLAGNMNEPDWWQGEGKHESEALQDKTYSTPREPHRGAIINFEVAPDPRNTELTARWDALPTEVKARVSHDIAWSTAAKAMSSVFTTGTGKPLVLKGELHQQLGGWMDATNPSLSIWLDPNISAAKAVDLARVLGYALNQQGMMFSQPKKFKGGTPMGVVAIDIPAGGDVHAIYTKLREIPGPDGEPLIYGHTTVDGKMAIMLEGGEARAAEVHKLILAKLGEEYNVGYWEAHAAFPEKGSDDYGFARENRSDEVGAQPSVRAAADQLRTEAAEKLNAAIERHEQSSAAGGAKEGRLNQAGRETPEQIDNLLQEYGEGVTSIMDAERRFNDGERLFVAHDMGDTPTEVIRTTQLKGYTADQIIALPAGILEQPAYHGTPHNIGPEGFSTSKIGTGEGAQAYGWGLYFAENPNVAKDYHRKLAGVSKKYFVDGKEVVGDPYSSDPMEFAVSIVGGQGMKRARQLFEDDYSDDPAYYTMLTRALDELEGKKLEVRDTPLTGGLYQVDIPDEHAAKMLRWDKPLSEQPAEVRAALADLLHVTKNESPAFGNEKWLVGSKDAGSESGISINAFATKKEALAFVESATGEKIYKGLEPRFGPQGASKKLEALGIPGIKYLDAGSRTVAQRQAEVADYKKAIARDEAKIADLEKEIADNKGNSGLTQQFFKRREQDIANLRKDIEGWNTKIESLLAEKETHNLVVFDDKIIKITHKDGSPVTQAERDAYLQKQQPDQGGMQQDQARGYLSIDSNRQMTMGFLESTDPSTPIHERAHFFLEMLDDLAAEHPMAEKEMQVLFKEWGITRDQWNGMDLNARREHHEQFARSWENYLMTNKAPTPELRSVFRRFRDWLIAIYESAQTLNVKVSQEMRDLFDRMHGSQLRDPSTDPAAKAAASGSPPPPRPGVESQPPGTVDHFPRAELDNIQHELGNAGLEATPRNVVDADAVTIAMQIDEGMVKSLAKQYDADDAGFMAEIRRMIDDHQNPETAAGGQEAVGQAQEGLPAARPAAEPGTKAGPAGAGSDRIDILAQEADRFVVENPNLTLEFDMPDGSTRRMTAAEYLAEVRDAAAMAREDIPLLYEAAQCMLGSA